ncbi:MAG TPA: PepSY domain-containing protein [Pirellulales bacterium]|nr:PepSY domain-containing protein [Pirellulales bacterium]
MRKMGFLVFLTLLVAGCGKKTAEPVEMMSLEQVPEAVMKAARDKRPDVKFDTAWKKKEDGRDVYEVRGKTAGGKTIEVELTPSGEVIAVE